MNSLLRSRRGLTLVELCIGMAITGMIGVATTSFVLAAAGVWREPDAEQALRLTAAQTSERIAPGLRGALRIECTLGTGDGLAGVSYWAVDDAPGNVDRLPQAGEMRLIQYDSATGILWLYTARPVAELNTSQKAAANTTLTAAQLTDRTAIERIKTASWAQAYAIYGATASTTTGNDIARLSGAAFALTPANDGSRECLDLTLNFRRGSAEVRYSARFTPRAPLPTN